MHRPTRGSRRGNTAQEVYYTRRLITAREQGDPKGEASMHLNNLLGQLLHLHIWALPCHWGTMIHFPTPDSALTSIKKGGYKACLTACFFFLLKPCVIDVKTSDRGIILHFHSGKQAFCSQGGT